MPLDGRTALVTGGSSGIGRGLTRAFAAAGARVFSVARSEDELRETAHGLETVTPIPADLTTAAGRATVRTAIDHATDRLDVAVHAAGALGPVGVPLAEITEDVWREVLEVNLTAIHLLHAAIAGLMERSSSPVVIGVSSTVGRSGRGGWGVYAVSKHALEGWLSTLADEFPGRVHSVNPGGTRTPMRAEARPDEDPATIPTPEDIAPIFLHLAQAESNFPTGSLLDARDFIGADPWATTLSPHDG